MNKIIQKKLLLLILTFSSFELFAQNQVYVTTFDSLYLVDISTCATQNIGHTGSHFFDIAINPINQEMYGVAIDGKLYNINKTTAIATEIGPTSKLLNSLTFSKKGTLYGMGAGNTIYSVDLSTGVLSEIGTTDLSIYPAGDIALLNGKLYVSEFFDNGKMRLVEIDIDNINNPRVIDTRTAGDFLGLREVYGLASIGCEPELYAFSVGSIFKVPNQDATSNIMHCYQITPCCITGVASLAEDIDFSEFDLKDSINLCEDETIDLDATICNARYTWQDGNSSSNYTVSESGMYSVTVAVNNCEQEDSSYIHFTDNPKVNLGGDSILCADETLFLDASFPNSTYLWQDGSMASDYLIRESGLYVVTITVNNCAATDSIYIDYTTAPKIYWNDYPRTICEDTSLILDATNLHTTTTYTWQDYSTDPTFWVQEAGIYTVTVSNHCGSNTTSIEIKSKECNCFEGIPNIFTPNEDGINDRLGVLTSCPLELANFEVYNRWGQQVYQSNNINSSWDGTYKGVNAPTEVYIYLLQYYDDYGILRSKKGEVTLAR